MTLTNATVLVLVVVLTATSCAPLLLTEPFIRGSIVATGDGWVDVRHKSGRVVRVLIVPTTVLTGAAPTAVTPALTRGRRVTLTLATPGAPFVARELRVWGLRN